MHGILRVPLHTDASMQIRRCSIVMFEPRVEVALDLDLLLKGEAGLGTTMQWYALAAHLDAPLRVEAGDVELLGRIVPDAWVDAATTASSPSRPK